ncbi:hypothetical protein BJF79_03420 [Actinomadura sp. CNU-125]|uniref:hypothetical protein n=1 Tax=Actinomadura sp. CNU-125 TaxID=1904961 RepID=UPI00095934ED|nr:hypothetical protein [Actinomadura sp. CNU-125]OLT12963.1 hypothetical protein BJF79_03420 [Actinomadura sp. CNU-125]
MNTDEPTGVDMATTAGWRFGGKWALAGVATTVLAIEVFTVQKVLYATGCALVLAYAAGVAVGWRMRRHGNGR